MEDQEPMRMFFSDSPATDDLVVLTTYLADLEMTSDALARYREAKAIEDAPVEVPDISMHLLNSAAISYWRCFSPSKVRPSLLHWLDVPTDLSHVHELARTLRHESVAHSASDLLETQVVAFLTKRGGQHAVKPVVLETRYMGAPSDFIGSFSDLVNRLTFEVQSLVDQKIAVVDRENSSRDAESLWNQSLKVPNEKIDLIAGWHPGNRRQSFAGVVHFDASQTEELRET